MTIPVSVKSVAAMDRLSNVDETLAISLSYPRRAVYWWPIFKRSSCLIRVTLLGIEKPFQPSAERNIAYERIKYLAAVYLELAERQAKIHWK
jgi:hypothetical protein